MADRRPEVGEEILERLKVDSPVHLTVLAEDIDCHPITVEQVCARLQAGNQLNMVSEGRYEISEKGEERIGDDTSGGAYDK